MSYLDLFHTDNWLKASVEEKLKALQLLENEHAKLQGRPPCKIRLIDDDLDIIGYKIENKDIIELNRKYLEGTYQENPVFGMSNYICCHYVLHEGRHAYQEYAIKNDIHPDKAEVQKWKENYEIYFTTPDHYYYFQPIERDANIYAEFITEKIYKQLEQKFGKDTNYEVYKNSTQLERIIIQQQALKYFGRDNVHDCIKIIESKISERYQNKFLNVSKQKSPKEILDSWGTDNKDIRQSMRSALLEAAQERKELTKSIDLTKEQDLER